MSSIEDFSPNTFSVLTKQILSGPSNLSSTSFLKSFTQKDFFQNIQPIPTKTFGLNLLLFVPFAVNSSAELWIFFFLYFTVGIYPRLQQNILSKKKITAN